MIKKDFHDPELFIGTDHYTGLYIFYLDKDLKIGYNGIILDYFKGILNWEFEVKNGLMNGIEKVYYEHTGELAEENEMKNNQMDGLAKEFYKNGNIQSISIAIKDVLIYSVCYDENGNITKKIYWIKEDEINSPKYKYIRNDIPLYFDKYKNIKELDLQ